MRRRVSNPPSLIFARRKSGKGFQKRRKKLFSLKKVLTYSFFAVLACASIFGGYLFARFGNVPVFFEKKELEKVVIPINISESNKELPIEKLLEKEDIFFDSVSKATTSATLVIMLEKNSFAYLDFSEDLEPQVQVLANIIKRVKIDNPGKKIKYIDLRFGKPIIKF